MNGQQGYTLDELNAMGAKSVGQQSGGFTAEELDQAGATGVNGKATSASPSFFSHPIDATVNAVKNAASFVGNDLAGNQQKSDSFLGSLYQGTVGSRGITGLIQAPVKAIESKIQAKTAEDLFGESTKLLNLAAQNMKMASSATDPSHKAQYLKMAQDNQTQANNIISEAKGLTSQAEQNNVTPGNLAGKAINTALTVGTGGTGSIARQVGLTGLKKTAATVAENAGIGVGFNAGTNMQDNKGAFDNAGEAGAISAAIPIAGKFISKIGQGSQTAAEGIINKLIKPAMKDLGYGKDPARGILNEGISANSFEDLKKKVSDAVALRGQQIGQLGQQIQKKLEVTSSQGPKTGQMGQVSGQVLQKGGSLDLSPAIKPIDEAMQQAAKLNNPTLLKSLENVKTALTHDLKMGTDEAGNATIEKGDAKNLLKASYLDAIKLMSDIGDHTKWTGNPSDDKALNLATQNAQRALREIMNKTADSVDPALGKQLRELNQRYGDLIAAKNAISHREIVTQRNAYFNLATKIGWGASTAITIGKAAATGDWSHVGTELLVEAGGALGLKGISSAAFQTRVAKLLNALGPTERQSILNSTPVLKSYWERMTGQQTPSPESPKTLPKTALDTISETSGVVSDKIKELLPFLELGKKSANKAGMGEEYDKILQTIKGEKPSFSEGAVPKTVNPKGFADNRALIGAAAAGAGAVTALNASKAFAPTETAQSTPQTSPQIKVQDRGVTILPKDLEVALPTFFGEVSNRNSSKKELELRVIFNTAINRMKEYAAHGQPKTLAEVLSMPNQYQAYNSKQYNQYLNSASDTPTAQKKEEVNAIIKKFLKEIKDGTFKDNTDGATFYKYLPDGRIIYDNTRKLFK